MTQQEYIRLLRDYRKEVDSLTRRKLPSIVGTMAREQLIRQYHDSHLENKEIVVQIGRAIDSSVELRNKKELIEQFIASLSPSTQIDDDWQRFVDEKRQAELDRIISEENLNRDEAYRFVVNAFRDGYVPQSGTAITKVLPPVSRFSPSGDRTRKRETVLEKLKSFFDRFFDISGETV